MNYIFPMLDYLKKFNSLPAELRRKVSNPKAIATIEMLEKKYGLLLASLVMKVMVREIAFKDLTAYLKKEDLSDLAAGQLARELKEKIFFSLADHLPAGQAGLPAQAGRTGGQAGLPVSPSAPALASQPASSRPRQVVAGRPTSPGPKKPAVEMPVGEPVVKGAGFFFSADDEAEIKELSKKINLAERTDLPGAVIEEKLKEIVNRTQINFGSADLVDRFRQILKIYLRGIRNKLETKLTFIKPFLNGGLSFDENSAEKVMRIADKVLSAQPGEVIEPMEKIKIPALVERDAPYDFSILAGKQKASIPGAVSKGKIEIKPQPDLVSRLVSPSLVELTPPKDVDHELAPLTPAVINDGAPKNIKSAPEKKSFRPVLADKVKLARPPTRFAEAAPFTKVATEAEPAKRAGQAGLPAQTGRTGRPATQIKPQDASQMPLIRRRFEAENLNVSQKMKIEDVKYVPKVMSPLDELKYLDLVNFRRLDKDPLKAIEKIVSKIDLLTEEGYGKRLEGIKLWRSSPINKLYLVIGQMSISENKPVDVIIEERKIKGGEYLTTAEFEAVMDLNKSLRF